MIDIMEKHILTMQNVSTTLLLVGHMMRLQGIDKTIEDIHKMTSSYLYKDDELTFETWKELKESIPLFNETYGRK